MIVFVLLWASPSCKCACNCSGFGRGFSFAVIILTSRLEMLSRIRSPFCMPRDADKQDGPAPLVTPEVQRGASLARTFTEAKEISGIKTASLYY